MKDSVDRRLIGRYHEAFELPESDRYDRLESLLRDHPRLAKQPLTDGSLPLRKLLGQPMRGLFSIFVKAGAEHDLLTACATVDLDAVKSILAETPGSVFETDADGSTPLHWACTAGHAEQPCPRDRLVEMLIEAGADTEAVNRYGETAIDCSILNEGGQPIDVLLEHGAVPTVRLGVAWEDYEFLDEELADRPSEIGWLSGRNGQSLLHLAAEYRCGAAMIEYLVERGAACVLESRSRPVGRTPLLYALEYEAYDEAEALLRAGADAAATEHSRAGEMSPYNALDLAVRKDRLLLAEQLLECGAKPVSSRNPEKGLLDSARSGEMAELLLARGLDPLVGHPRSGTPFDSAIEEGQTAVVGACLDAGVPATLFALALLGRVNEVRDLLNANPGRVSERFTYGVPRAAELELRRDQLAPLGSVSATPLHYASKGGSESMVSLLLDRNADVHAAGLDGWTPLHDATYYTIYNDLPHGARVIERLVAGGADLDARTVAGYQPLDIADYLSGLSCADRAADIFDLLERLKRESRR